MEETKVAKAKETFRVAHPPPRSKHQQRLHIHPKCLLQLQHLSENNRAQPVFDVVPIAHHLHLRRLKIERGLEANDLLVLSTQSQALSAESDGSGGEDGDVVDKDHLIAVLRFASDRNGRPWDTIEMEHGRSWSVRRLRSGTYEFASLDQHPNKTVARWVPKRYNKRATTPGEGASRHGFTFSVISPDQRRHPIIATMKSEVIELSDQHIPSKSWPVSTQDDLDSSAGRASRPGVASIRDYSLGTDDLKTFILTAGLWVTLKEGVSPHFASDRYSSPTMSPVTGQAQGSKMASDTKIFSAADTNSGSGSDGTSKAFKGNPRMNENDASSTDPIPKDGLSKSAINEAEEISLRKERRSSRDRKQVSTNKLLQRMAQRRRSLETPRLNDNQDGMKEPRSTSTREHVMEGKTKSNRKFSCVFRRSK